MDELIVEMCFLGRFFFYRYGFNMDRLLVKVFKLKYLYKVNVWGGILCRGKISICIFFGIMDLEIY